MRRDAVPTERVDNAGQELVMMHDTYGSQLTELSTQLGHMAGLASAALRRATQAVLSADAALAQQVSRDHEQIAGMSLRAQRAAFTLLTVQAPVVCDLRAIVTVIQIGADLNGMGSLALHIADIARRRHPEHAVPVEMRCHVDQMGRVAAELGRKTQAVLLPGGPHETATIHAGHATMDALHRQLSTIAMGGPVWKHGVTAAVDVTLLSRYYEHFGGHAVEVARRVTTQSTGASPDQQHLATVGGIKG